MCLIDPVILKGLTLMRKTIIAASLATVAGLAAPMLSIAAEQSPHTITGNASIVSDYRFRGITQTYAKPALQGGIDYSHASGLYLGNWNSNVNEGAGFPAGNLEMDFYGGYKQAWGDFGIDVGAIYYAYPGSDASIAAGTGPLVNPRNGKTHTGAISNTELYIGGSWKWLSLKYSQSTSDYFSLPDTKGSSYLDLTGNYDLGGGWTLVGHVGSFKLKGWSTGAVGTNANYTDWKLGVTKDYNGWLLGAAYIDTNAKGSCSKGEFYCFSNQAPFAPSSMRDAGKGTVVLSVSKSF